VVAASMYSCSDVAVEGLRVGAMVMDRVRDVRIDFYCDLTMPDNDRFHGFAICLSSAVCRWK
jgi:hypothetical protein